MACLMKTGRFVYDNSGDLNSMVIKAARLYYVADGVFPDRAHVHPLICPEETVMTVDGSEIVIAPDSAIAKHIIWIGEGVK